MSVIVTFEGEVEDVPGKTYPVLVETKGPNPIEFENGYVAYEDLPDEQKHLPGESTWGKSDDPADADDQQAITGNEIAVLIQTFELDKLVVREIHVISHPFVKIIECSAWRQLINTSEAFDSR